MTVFLLVLKIIGLVLAGILAFAVFLLLLVLFCPIKYCVKVNGVNKEIEAKATAKWLFGLGGAKAFLEDKILSYKAGVIGINFIKENKKTRDEVEAEVETGIETESESLGEIEEIIEAEKKGEDSISVRVLLNRIYEKTKELLEKIKNIHEKAKLIKFIVEAPATRRALGVFKIRIFNLLNHVKPYIIKGGLTLGLSDAASTAVAYGALSCVAEVLSFDRFMIVPDFDNEGFTVERVTIKGRVFVFYVVWQVMKVVLNRDVQRVVRKIRRSF